MIGYSGGILSQKNMFEWDKEYKRNAKPFTTKEMHGRYSIIIDALEKLEFKPTVVVNYVCAYGSNVPSRKYVFKARINKVVHKISLFECIHFCQFEFVIGNNKYVSDSFPSVSYALYRSLAEFVLEHYKWSSNFTLPILKYIPKERPSPTPNFLMPTVQRIILNGL